MSDGDNSADPSTDANLLGDRPVDEPGDQSVDQVLVTETATGPTKVPLVVALGVLVVVLLGVGVVLVTSGSSDTASSSSPPRIGVADSSSAMVSFAEDSYLPPTYELVGALPDLGTTATAYEIDGTVDEETVANWATILGVGSPVRTESGWTAEGDKHMFMVEVSEGRPTSVQYSQRFESVGAAISSTDPAYPATTTTTPGVYEDPSVGGSGDVAPPANVPSDEEAVTIAKELLGRMGVIDGDEWSFESSAGAEFAAVGCAVSDAPAYPADPATNETTSTTYAPYPCGEVSPEPQIMSRTVVATRTVDGKDTDALFWNVTVGSGGTVEDLSGQFGSVTPLGAYDLQPTAGAFAQLQDGSAIVLGPYSYPVRLMAAYDGTTATTYEPETLMTVAPPMPAGPDEGPVYETTTTYDTGSGAEPGMTEPGASDPSVSNTPGTASAEPPPDYAEMPDYQPEPYVIRITGARLALSAAQGQVDGSPAALLLPVYVFEVEGAEDGVGHRSGVSVLALVPGTFDLVGATPDDTTITTGTVPDPGSSTEPGYPIDPGSPGQPGDDVVCVTDPCPGATGGGSDGSSGGCPGNDYGAPTTFACGPDTTVSSDTPVSSEPSTNEGG